MTEAAAVDDALALVLARFDRPGLITVDPSVVPTRFPSLDRALGGGVRRGDLLILGGDHGAGCSALALGIALRASPRAILLTGESHPERIHERALAMTARIPVEALRLGALDDEARARVADAAPLLRARAPVVETLYRGGSDLVNHALDTEPTAPLVVIDAIESIVDDVGERRYDDAIAETLLALKRVALERNVALLLLAHLPALDRDRANRRPRLTDFPGRGAAGAHADVVLAVYREDQYDGDLGVRGATELLVLKQRDGALGYVDLYFDAPYLRFEDLLEG